VYLSTLAPTVTLWDSGEFLAAAHSLGIPHPPGTPLFIFGARAWATLLGWLPFAFAVNLASAVSTAVAAALIAWLLARWTGRAGAGIAGALIGGAMAAVWQSATEAEVYSYALLVTALLLVAAELAAVRRSARYRALVAFLFGLAVPLHLSVLVAGPSIVLLVATDADGRVTLRHALEPTGAWMLAVGLGTVSRIPAIAGCALLLASVALPAHAPGGSSRREGLVALTLTLLGASFVVAMLFRARHDPAINEGNPIHWQAMLDVVARRQYDLPPLWPRRAPLWLQLGNVVQYADWQVAAGVSDNVGASPWRTPVTLAFAALAIVGSIWHRARDRRSWRVLGLLLLSATGGVVLVLNLRAGPSYGWGILPDGAMREARERDYFFALAFLLAGLWSGCGVVAITERLRSRWRHCSWLLVVAPVALNWRAVDRRRGPDAWLATDIAAALLAEVPARAVLVLAGDNDSFPLWFAQQVHGIRPDVTPVTIPLLGASWYRQQLARRDGLLGSVGATRWMGYSQTLAAIGAEGRRQGRPVVAAVSVRPLDRASLAAGAGWTLSGMWYVPVPMRGLTIDTLSTSRAVRWWLDRQRNAGAVSRPSAGARDPAGRYLQHLLTCPERAMAHSRGTDEGGRELLESICNFR
jgi:hypothetical protein